MSWAIWITGLPGSGKSVIARAAAERLRAQRPALIELDTVRRVLTPRPTYSDAERSHVYRALVYIAATLAGAGVPVIIDATAHRREWRDLARATIRHFAEVQLECPLSVCREREAARRTGNAPAGIYARAGRPGATVPGVDVEYERSGAAELVVHTDRQSVEDAADAVASLAGQFPGRSPARSETPAWVMWITGLPGSGKTTLAVTVAERLHADGVAPVVLDLLEARAAIAAGTPPTPDEDETAHLALACAAKALSDAGVPAIVDATAPRRAWRERARTLIPHFAEVQLMCPDEICGSRERAVRWHLSDCSAVARSPNNTAPEVVLGYQYALSPDVILHTDVEDPWTAADRLLALARRLHHTAVHRGEATWPAPRT